MSALSRRFKGELTLSQTPTETGNANDNICPMYRGCEPDISHPSAHLLCEKGFLRSRHLPSHGHSPRKCKLRDPP
jgi:hypothetical protein